MDISDSNFETIRLPKNFITGIMPNIPSDYLKIYITGLILNNEKKVLVDDISNSIGIDHMIVISAFEYLQKQGLVTIKNQDVVWIEFNVPDSQDGLRDIASNILYKDAQYNDQLQSAFGTHILSVSQFKLIYDWTDVFKLPKSVCLSLIKYCQDRKGQNTNIAYMNAVAKSWAEKKIDSSQMAELEIERYERVSSGANKILSFIGGYGRLPSKPEMDLYTKWVENWGFTLDSIIMAIENISATTNPSFKYIDKVLEGLKQKGKTTSRTISEHNEAFDGQKMRYNVMLDMIDAKHTPLNYDKIGAFIIAGFDEKIISLAFKQASMREKHSINYIETILYNWKSNGLDDITAIESDINERKDKRDKAYAFYKKSGLDGRLTQFQIEAFEKWLFNDGFEYDMMLEVADYSKASKNANQYMAKIFSSMKEKSILTKSGFLADIKNIKKDTSSDSGKKATQYSAEDFQNMLTDIE